MTVETVCELLPPETVAVPDWPDDAVLCACSGTTKGTVARAVLDGHASLASLGHVTGVGTEPGCGECHARLGQVIAAYKPHGPGNPPALKKNKIEVMKREKDGLDCLPDIEKIAETGNWEEMTEDDKQRFKWHGLFFRKQTPGHFMFRIRATSGFTDASQFRVIADLSDEYGKGFCDLTTRQQVQMRWFTIRDVPDIWRRLAEAGLTTKQTGMDNIRGVCGCPVAGLTPHELLDASGVGRAFTELILDNKEFTNLPRKFNVTITGCLENCCHTETQDLALVPSYRELDGTKINGFNVVAGGKQGSGGYTPAQALDVFVRPQDAPERKCATSSAFTATTDRVKLAIRPGWRS